MVGPLAGKETWKENHIKLNREEDIAEETISKFKSNQCSKFQIKKMIKQLDDWP